jgi:DNA-binding beta-propeller fold protein YncE
MVALPNSSRVYVSGSRPFGDDGAVPIFYVIDTATRAVIARSTTAKIGPMAASPSGSFLYIATSSGIQIFDTATNAVTGTLPITGIYGIAFSPNGDTATGLVTGSISLGSSITPLGITVSPDGTQVWVTPASSNSVIVVNPVSATAQSVNLGATVYGVAFGVP